MTRLTDTEDELSESGDQEGELEEYKYQSLPDFRSIRLLMLQSGSNKDQDVTCELITRNFDIEPSDDQAKVEYEALSWSWGPDSENRRIKIRESDETYYLSVKPSLVHALSALRRKRKVRTLWVDAICINQRDPQEKNHQVPMMSTIYGRAKNVCIWLGRADKDSKIAIDFIKQEVLKLQKFDDLCESQEAAAKWRAMLNLMKRPWFSRRWVVQEIALAENAELYCGTKRISWKDFADAVQLFVEVESATHRLSEVMRKDPTFYHIPGWFEYVSALGASLLVDATGTLFRVSKGKKRQLLSLEYLVSRLSVFEATVPHDIIYALLAIAKDANPIAIDKEEGLNKPTGPGTTQLLSWATGHGQAKRYPVDYSQPFVDIYKDFIEFSIRQSSRADPTRALDIICRPWAPDPINDEPALGASKSKPWPAVESMRLPSWIPRLSGAANSMFVHPNGELKMGRQNADPLVGLPLPGQREYSAAETRKVEESRLRFKKRDNHYSMYVSGFVLDEVDKREVASQGGNIPNSWIRAVGWKNTEQDPPEEFWRTLVADRGRHGRNPPTYYGRACKESITKGLPSGSLNTTDLINEGRCSVVAEFFRRVQAVIWNRALMRTKNRHLGIIQDDAEAGDLICILYGCSVPVILRRMQKTPQGIETEQKEDAKELEERKLAAAFRLLEAYREKKRRAEKKQRQMQSASKLESVAESEIHDICQTAGPMQEIGTDVDLPNGDTENGLKPTSASSSREDGGPNLEPIVQNGMNGPSQPKTFNDPKPSNEEDPGKSADSAPKPEPHLSEDMKYWYEFKGPCYVHGMMDGEAIKYQNQRGVAPQIFELR